MAFPTGTETATTLAQLIPNVWGQKINDFFKLKLMMADFFVNRSDELADGGITIYTPNLTEFSANTKTTGSGVTLNSVTETSISLNVSTWKEVSFAIEDKEAAQVKHSYYLQEKYAMNAGYTVAKSLEGDIANLFKDLNASTTLGSSTVNVADSDIRAAISTLESVGIDTSTDCAFFFHPAVFWKQLQNIDKFSLAINTPVQDPVAKRPTASLYGIPVYISANIKNVSGATGRYNVLANKDAIHWAAQALGSGGSMAGTQGGNSFTGTYGVRVQSSYIPDYLSTITTADLCYGVVENRDNAGVCIMTPA